MQIMVDLETLGTKPGSVIVSIGAVAFDPMSNIVRTDAAFYTTMQIQPQLDKGMTVDGSTLSWWMQQSDDARKRLATTEAGLGPVAVLTQFNEWYISLRGEAIWGHRLNFDIPLLESLYRAMSMKWPWKYSQGRDTRTLFDLAGRKMGGFGTPNALAHDALLEADAAYQAYETMYCINYIMGRRIEASRPTTATPATNGDIR